MGCFLRFGRDENGRIALFQIVLGLMCPGGLSGGGESQNEAKSRRFGMDMPSRAFYEGVNPKTILNNCPESTKRHIGQLLICHIRKSPVGISQQGVVVRSVIV